MIVNPTLVTAFLRQRFTSPIRLILLLVVGWMPMLPVLLSPGIGFTMLGGGSMIALVVGAGLIGQDIASGTLPLLLARPVSRPEYVVSRWLGAALGAWLVVLLQALTAAGVMVLRGAPVPMGDAALFLANGALSVLGTTALLALLSALMDGLGDLGLLLILFITVQVVEGMARMKGLGWLVRSAEEMGRVLQPGLSLAPFFGPAPVSWFEVVSYLSTLTLCLTGAILLVNRRELSYASTGA